MASQLPRTAADPQYMSYILGKVFISSKLYRLDLKVEHLVVMGNFQELMTRQELETLQLQNTNTRKLQDLKDIAIRRWTFKAFEDFLEVLRYEDVYTHVADELEKNYVELRQKYPTYPAPTIKPNIHLVNYSSASNAHRPRGSQPPNSAIPELISNRSSGWASTNMNVMNPSPSFSSASAANSGRSSHTSRNSNAMPGELSSNLTIRSPTVSTSSSSWSNVGSSNSEIDRQQQTSVMRDYFQQESAGDVYNMNTTPRGMALVINNEEFDNFPTREGSQRDKERFSSLFRFLNFEVNFQNNLTAKDMLKFLKLFAAHKNLARVSACFVVIMTHGSRGDVLLGKDGRLRNGSPVNGTYINKMDIQNIFNAKSCPFLKNKPKGFIFQACRGGLKDLTTARTEQKPSSGRAMSGDGKGGASSMNDAHDSHDGRGDSSSMDDGDDQIPETADFLFAFPSASGYEAYRHPQIGSPFVTMLTEMIRDLAGTCDMEEILRKLRLRCTQPLHGQAFVTPESSSTLRKQWYLNPPN